MFNVFGSLHLIRWGTRDVKPLVDAWVNWVRGLVLAGGYVERVRVLVVGRTRNGSVDKRQVLLGRLARGELFPSLSTLTDNVHGILLVLALAREGKLVLRLAVGDLVDTEPLIRGAEKARKVALDVFDIIQLRSQGVVDVNDHDLPVGLTLIKESHDTKHLDLDNLTRLSNELSNLANVQWIIVALGLGLLVGDVRVLPGLHKLSVLCISSDVGLEASHLREGTIVPQVALVGEAIPHEAELSLLRVL